MKTVLISYADQKMTISQQLLTISALKHGGVTNVTNYTDPVFSKEFQYFNADIVSRPQRGGGRGFWIFKPYICYSEILKLDIGDILIYADAGIEFIADVQPVIDMMNARGTDYFFFGNGHKHADWCKAEVIHEMLSGAFRASSAEQCQASVMFFRVSPDTVDFIKTWLMWAQIPGMIDDTLRGPQVANFKDHRNDQSILTNLIIKKGINLDWWPVQYGHHIRAQYRKTAYKQLFYHHRFRNGDWTTKGYSSGNVHLYMEEDKSV